jgi:PAS domain S-box-containing protein
MDDRERAKELLRAQAEMSVQKRMSRIADHLDDLSPEEIKRIFHELQVYQVELEIQNEELRRAQLEIDETKRRYFDLYDMAPIGYFTLNDKGLIMEANLSASTMLGLPCTHLLKQAISRFILKEDQDIYYLYSKKVFESGKPQSCELRMVNEKKMPFWVHMVSSTGKDADGTPILRLVLSDISESKAMEEELILKDQMMIAQSRQAAMGEMISMIAHQWRQPLNIISLAVSNIETTYSLHLLDEKTLETNTEIIAKNIFHMSNTIDAFRNFFKPEHAKELVGIEDVIRCTVEMIGQSLKNENISLKIENNSHSPMLIFKSSLIQVMLNILNNAKDEFLTKKVTQAAITVTVNETLEGVTIAICDNAGGIPKSIIDKLGQPYFTTKKLTGTGLGLHISKTIVEKYLLGSFSWHNEKDGACFVITLKH